MDEMLGRFEAYLEDLRRRLERIEARLQPEPTCLVYPEAAKRLGVGLTKLKAMIRAGEIRTARVGRVPMVPVSEIHRASTPEAERPRVATAKRAATWRPVPKRRRG
jgi:excisionase family DNA binding protein